MTPQAFHREGAARRVELVRRGPAHRRTASSSTGRERHFVGAWNTTDRPYRAAATALPWISRVHSQTPYAPRELQGGEPPSLSCAGRPIVGLGYGSHEAASVCMSRMP